MDVLSYVERLSRREKLTEYEVHTLCDKAAEILRREPNVLSLPIPLSVCGDVHGQLYDLLELFQVAGRVPQNTFLFLGDYVDRGYNSVETYLILLCYKVKYPTRMFMIRGNHESLEITQVYGFYDEVMRRYGTNNVWRHCLRTFNLLPLGAIIDNRVFAMHGGLSPGLKRIDDLRTVDRDMEVPHSGEMCDLLWSDPDENLKGWHVSPRGAGFLFGGDVLDVFRRDNKVDYIARAHQLVMEGFKWNFNQTCLTVWSAPNYCYRCGNVASVLELSEGRRTSFTIFEAAPAEVRGQVTKIPSSQYFY